MKVFVLGLDGATWDILGPLEQQGLLPNLSALMKRGSSGVLHSTYPPLSPVAWTTIMTGKNPGKHGVYEFLEHEHNPLKSRVNSSRSIRSELVWEVAARQGKRAIAGAVPMSYPHREVDSPSLFVGDFLSPPNAPQFCTDDALYQEMEKAIGGPYRPWSAAVHDGGREAEALTELTEFLDHHLKAVEFLMSHREWDLFMYDLMAVDRIQHELWHVWNLKHWAAQGRERELEPVRQGFIQFWRKLDEGIGRIESNLPDDATLLLISDHGFGGIEWYVNLNVWLLDEGFIGIKDGWYYKQKQWFFRRGITPQWFYQLMVKFGGARSRVSRFQGKQTNWLDRLGETGFLSRRHMDWSKTKAYAQGNFGQIFLNLKGRQPHGCVDPKDARSLLDDIKGRLRELKHPETNEPLIDQILERDDLYQGPMAHLAPDLTAIPSDWRCRTIGLHDFTTHKAISRSFGPTGDHRMEGVFIAAGPGIRPGAKLQNASLLDVAPTALALLNVPIPNDMDGRPLEEVFTPQCLDQLQFQQGRESHVAATAYGADDEDAIQKRLADLGYL